MTWGKEKFWTDERLAELRELAEQGLTPVEIGEHFGKSGGSVRGQAGHHHIKMNYRTGKWDDDEDRAMKAMFTTGSTVSQISDELNRPESQIRYKLQEAGLKVGERRKAPKHYGERETGGRDERARRRCLGGCGEMFDSTHKGNRICPSCSKMVEWQAGA